MLNRLTGLSVVAVLSFPALASAEPVYRKYRVCNDTALAVAFATLYPSQEGPWSTWGWGNLDPWQCSGWFDTSDAAAWVYAEGFDDSGDFVSEWNGGVDGFAACVAYGDQGFAYDDGPGAACTADNEYRAKFFGTDLWTNASITTVYIHNDNAVAPTPRQ